MVRVNGGATAGLCLAAIASFSSSSAANAAMVTLDGRRSRYFCVQQMLPPLSRHMPSFANQTDILPYSSPSPHARSLPVMYTNDPRRISDWLSEHLPSSNGILGFDVESVPHAPWVKRRASFEGPATVQLATTESCLVVHLTRGNGRPSRACAPILEAVLADESIVKAGVGIDQDMVELSDCWGGLQARSRLDVCGIGFHCNGNTVGLQRLTSSILGLDLGKTKKQAVSDWSQVPLSDEQLIYSARDAWAGAAIVAELASVAPDTFGTAALIDLLKSERSMDDLMHLVKSRERAKTQLASILRPYISRKRPSATKSPPVQHKSMPPKVRKKVSKLKQVVSQTVIGGPMVFDVESLGFTIHPSKQL